MPKSMRCSKNNPKREVRISIGLSQKKKKERKKSQIKILTYYLKELENGEQTELRSQQKEGKNQDQRGNA